MLIRRPWDYTTTIHVAQWRRREAYRHWAFVSCEFIEMFARFCFPDHYQLVHITSGLQKKIWINVTAWRHVFASRSRTSHQIFSIWWNCHTQDMSSVPNMSVLCSFPSTWYCVKFFPALNIPWRYLKQNEQQQKMMSCINKYTRLNTLHQMQDFKHSHLIMEQSLAAEKMYLSSEVMTRQVIGSLCPLNSLMSEASGGKSWREEIHEYRRTSLQKWNI